MNRRWIRCVLLAAVAVAVLDGTAGTVGQPGGGDRIVTSGEY
jgi:hypothetical protein